MTPHEQMRKYDLSGVTYCVKQITFSNGDTISGTFAVINHAEEWIEIAETNKAQWIHMSNVAVMMIERLG